MTSLASFWARRQERFEAFSRISKQNRPSALIDFNRRSSASLSPAISAPHGLDLLWTILFSARGEGKGGAILYRSANPADRRTHHAGEKLKPFRLRDVKRCNIQGRTLFL